MLAFGDQLTFASPDNGLLEAEGLLDARLWVRTGSESGDGQSCLFEVVPLCPGEGEVAGQPVLYGYLIQLRHVRSGLFVALRERVLAHLEPDCLQVELGASDSSCWLSVQPGSSASRAEGECVRVGDRVLLLSAKTRQQLHCSAHTLPDLEPRERLSALAALQHGQSALTLQTPQSMLPPSAPDPAAWLRASLRTREENRPPRGRRRKGRGGALAPAQRRRCHRLLAVQATGALAQGVRLEVNSKLGARAAAWRVHRYAEGPAAAAAAGEASLLRVGTHLVLVRRSPSTRCSPGYYPMHPGCNPTCPGCNPMHLWLPPHASPGRR